MIRLVMIFMAVLLAAGCATVPFREAPAVSMETVDPLEVVAQFREHLPESFQLLNTVVFDYTWRKFLGVGYVGIDRTNDTFKVVCLNPMGVKLFDLTGDRNSVTPQDVIPALANYGDLPRAVGDDIRRIYFDLTPSAGAAYRKGSTSIRFWQPAGPGTLEYVFAGAGRNLVEKNYYENSSIVWRIAYYEYLEQAGKLYPQGTVLTNYQYGYELTVRYKELIVEKD